MHQPHQLPPVLYTVGMEMGKLRAETFTGPGSVLDLSLKNREDRSRCYRSTKKLLLLPITSGGCPKEEGSSVDDVLQRELS